MLLPPEVLPFLCHPHLDVRRHASQYLLDLDDSAPMETAATTWSAIDQFGESISENGLKQTHYLLKLLVRVPGNEASLNRALTALAAPRLDDDEVALLNRVLANTPLDLLEKNLHRILPVASEICRTAMEHRLSLRALSVQELWDQLVQQAEKADAEEEGDGLDTSAGPRLVEALSHDPTDAAPLAMQVLADPQERWWLEIWSADLLGRVRHTPAIDLLIDATQIEDADYLQHSAGHALARMLPAAVVPRLVAAYPSDDPFQRSFFAETLSKIKDPMSEQALMSLLADEKGETPTASLAMGLCQLCSTQGLELVRQVVLNNRYDKVMVDMKELLITTSAMTGFEFPEREKWKAELADPAYRQRSREQILASFGIPKGTTEQFEKYLQDPDNYLGNDMFDTSTEPAPLFEPQRSALPYRREQQKIGRNDPCTCGSGKKYKKCCGK